MNAGGYLSIDAILAEEERVPVTFQVGADRLGHLDATAGAPDIEEGQRVELPLWLAEPLAGARLVSVDLPTKFKKTARDKLLAAPEQERLRDRSPYFYEVGLRLARVATTEDAARLPAAIQSTLAARVNGILTRSQNSAASDPSAFVDALTEFERHIFDLGFRHARDSLAWRQGKSAEIKAVEGMAPGGGGGAGGGAGAGGGGRDATRVLRSFSGVPYKRKRSVAMPGT